MIPLKKRFSSGVVLCAGLALSLAGIAQAQPYFQSTFPGNSTLAHDAARGGVLLTNDGGTISVGESRSFGNSRDYDVYVVKTNECGFIQWSTTYNFGGNDYGRKIRQTSDGGYIITGSTDNTHSCCNISRPAFQKVEQDIFLLRIDSKGSTVWAKTYGGPRHDVATDVQIYPDEGFVVSGITQSFGDGKTNGYLMRTNSNGDIIWGRSYGQRDGAEILNSCTVTAKGDILAVGATQSFGNQNILAIRTDGNGVINPSIVSPPTWAEFFPYKGTGVARHIIEASDGTFVIAGWLQTLEPGTRDGYLLRIDGAGTAQFDQVFAGVADDEIAEIRETFDGDLVYTGYMTDAGFGQRDLLLCGVDYKFNPQWYSLHGGKRNDEGFSLAFDAERSKKYGAVYVAANGVTESFTKEGEDLYLIQAIKNGYTGCNDMQTKAKVFRPELREKQVEYCHPLALSQCNTKVAPVYNKDQRLLCTPCKKDLDDEGNEPDLGRLDRGIPSNGLTAQVTSSGNVKVMGLTETAQSVAVQPTR